MTSLAGQTSSPGRAGSMMSSNSCSVLAPAKLNLYLKVLGTRQQDAYHEMALVMQSVSLADRVSVQIVSNTTEFSVSCCHPLVPTDETNLALKAAKLMASVFPNAHDSHGGVEIKIDKRIPIGSGMAGGSADAAATLVAMNHLWELGLEQKELQQLGARLGCDIPFCISGGTVVGFGKGEILESLHVPPTVALPWVVIVKHCDLSILTVWAFQTYKDQFHHTYLPPHEQKLHQQTIHSKFLQSSGDMSQLLHNDFESVVMTDYCQVRELKDFLSSRHESLGTGMTGTGPTIFSICRSQGEANSLSVAVKQAFYDVDVWVCQFCATGSQIL